MPSNRMVSSVVMRDPRHSGAARSAEPGLQPSKLPGSRAKLAPRNDGGRDPPSLLRLAGILDRLEGGEFDVVEFAVDLLYLADEDVLHDVAGFRVDRDRPARALPLHALHRLDQRVAVGLAAGLLQRFVDQMDAVIAADRHEAGAVAE